MLEICKDALDEMTSVVDIRILFVNKRIVESDGSDNAEQNPFPFFFFFSPKRNVIYLKNYNFFFFFSVTVYIQQEPAFTTIQVLTTQ